MINTSKKRVKGYQLESIEVLSNGGYLWSNTGARWTRTSPSEEVQRSTRKRVPLAWHKYVLESNIIKLILTKDGGSSIFQEVICNPNKLCGG